MPHCYFVYVDRKSILRCFVQFGRMAIAGSLRAVQSCSDGEIARREA